LAESFNSKISIYKSACRMCHGGCGVLVHVQNSKVIKITGDPDSPINRGKMCVKGRASIEYLYNPDRLKAPIKELDPVGAEDGKKYPGKKHLRILWTRFLGLKIISVLSPYVLLKEQGDIITTIQYVLQTFLERLTG
jgi:hypothetical protein